MSFCSSSFTGFGNGGIPTIRDLRAETIDVWGVPNWEIYLYLPVGVSKEVSAVVRASIAQYENGGIPTICDFGAAVICVRPGPNWQDMLVSRSWGRGCDLSRGFWPIATASMGMTFQYWFVDKFA